MTASIDSVDISRLPRSFKNKNYQRKRHKNLKQLLSAEAANPPKDVNTPTFTNIEATPSLLPAKKYCDITGLEAQYTDPRTKLRYHNAEVYEVVKSMSIDAAQAYLALRNSQIVLK